MGMFLNDGAFFAATMKEIRHALEEAEEGLEALRNKLLGFGAMESTEVEDDEGDPTECLPDSEVVKKMYAMGKEEPDVINVNEEWERPFWRGAAALARAKMAARAQAFAVQMEQQKARRAMKCRKLKHADGSFPDWECGCVR